MIEQRKSPISDDEGIIINFAVRYDPYGHHKHGCQLRFFSTVGNPTTIEGAIRKWNRRAEDDKQV